MTDTTTPYKSQRDEKMLGDAKLMSARHQVLREQAEATCERRTTRMHRLEAGLARALEWLSDLSVELTDEGAIRLARLASTVAEDYEGARGVWYADVIHAEAIRDRRTAERDFLARLVGSALVRASFEPGARAMGDPDIEAHALTTVVDALRRRAEDAECALADEQAAHTRSTEADATLIAGSEGWTLAPKPGEVTWLAPEPSLADEVARGCAAVSEPEL